MKWHQNLKNLFVTIPNYKSNDPKKQPLTILLIAKFRKKCNFRNNHMVLPHHSNSSFWNYIFHLYSFNCITHNCTVIALLLHYNFIFIALLLHYPSISKPTLLQQPPFKMFCFINNRLTQKVSSINMIYHTKSIKLKF